MTRKQGGAVAGIALVVVIGWQLVSSIVVPQLARAVQNELVPPTSGIYTGVQYSQKIGDAFRSLASCNKGATAPANVGGSAVDGLCWIDDSGSYWLVKRYVNGAWVVEAALNPTDGTYIGSIGGGVPASIDSATGPVIDLGAVPQANISITGTSTLSGFGSSAPSGTVKFVRFTSALTLTNSTSLAVPGGFDLVTAAGDRATVTHLGSGNWEITQFTRANGIPIDISAVGKVSFDFSESVPPLHVAGYGQALSRSAYPAYLTKVARAQNGTRTSGNATITGLSNTAGFAAGMPVEGTGIAASCTIASVSSSSITLNSSSCVTASGTSTVTVFLYGYGASGDTTTVGVPDCRGRTLAGRDRNDPGSYANLITASASGINGQAFNQAGGNQVKTLLRSDLPNVAPSFFGAPSSVTVTGTQTVAPASAANQWTPGGGTVYGVTGAPITLTSTGSTTANGTIQSLNGGVAQTQVNSMQPTLIAECVIRVTP